MQAVTFVALGRDTLLALLEGDLARATSLAGVRFGDYFVSDELAWLWRIREEQLRVDPSSAGWVAFAVIDDATGEVVGHAGFHGPPDADRIVEIGYSIDPLRRRRGFAHAIVDALLARADGDGNVSTVRASIRPDNAASLATIAGRGFVRTGEQIDEVDGLEYIFDRPAR